MKNCKARSGGDAFKTIQKTKLMNPPTDCIAPIGEDLLLRALDTLADHVESAREGGDAPDDAGLIVEMEGAMAANAGSADMIRDNGHSFPMTIERHLQTLG